MALAQIDTMMVPLGDTKSGENCEYDQLYLGMDALAAPVAEQEVGESVAEGRDADFRQLQRDCESLWSKTRDLRVAAYFTIADFCNNGLEGLVQGLKLIDYLVTELWDEAYPQLDPDDDNDPTERLNILAMISPKQGAFSDSVQFINHFRQQKLVKALPYTMRDVMAAQGLLNSDGTHVDMSLVNAEISGGPFYDELQSRHAMTEEALKLLGEIADCVNSRIGDLGYVNFESLGAELNYLKKFYEPYISAGAATPAPAQAEEKKTVVAAAPAVARTAPTAPMFQAVDLKSCVISSRAEAMMMISKCSEYFKKAEPTSPMPYLLARALRMADMNFVDILAEIDQNALEKAREQLGVLPPSDN